MKNPFKKISFFPEKGRSRRSGNKIRAAGRKKIPQNENRRSNVR